MAWSAYYTLRLAIKNPDVSWAKKSNPEPWNEYANKQYKVSSFFPCCIRSELRLIYRILCLTD